MRLLCKRKFGTIGDNQSYWVNRFQSHMELIVRVSGYSSKPSRYNLDDLEKDRSGNTLRTFMQSKPIKQWQLPRLFIT